MEKQQEAAEKYAETYRCPATNENEYCKHDIISAFNNGAKWQQQRSYSEEDMKDAYIQGTLGLEYKKSFNESFYKWFEQFKKK